MANTLSCLNYPQTFGSAQSLSPQYAMYTGAKLADAYEINQGNEPSLSSELMGSGIIMGGTQILPKLIHPTNTYKSLKNANNAFKELYAVDTFKNLSSSEHQKAFSTLFNTERLSSKILKKGLRSPVETDKLKTALKETLEQYKQALKTNNPSQAAIQAAKLEALIKAAKKPGFFSSCFKKITGSGKGIQSIESVLNEGKKAEKAAVSAAKAASTATTTATTTAKAGLWFKDALKTGGAKGMAVISGAIETFTEILPAFSESTGTGIKQLGKSAVTVAADATGWCVGAKAGGSAGATIGTAIFPGIGTAIGGAIGALVGGIIGSWSARKIAKTIVGKSYSEKTAENQAKKEQQDKKMQLAQQNLNTNQLQAQPNNQLTYNPFLAINDPALDYNYNIDFSDYDFTKLA